jgi:SAM-dependent methyltransferase
VTSRELEDFERYDDVADDYARIAAPVMFSDVARDLVATVGVKAGDHVLDVGSGTGAVVTQALPAASPGGRVAAADLSAAMLSHVPGEALRAAGELPGLPFRNDVFDAVTASFVLSHIGDYAAGLRDMVRVARPGGRIGVTSWSLHENPYDLLWGEIAARFVDADELAGAARKSRVWQDWLADARNLTSALEEAGLENVTVQTRGYELDLPLDDFLCHKTVFLSGRFVRHVLSSEDWNEFQKEVRAAFQERRWDHVHFENPAHIAVGVVS